MSQSLDNLDWSVKISSSEDGFDFWKQLEAVNLRLGKVSPSYGLNYVPPKFIC